MTAAFPSRLAGVVTAPRATFAAVAARPTWVPALALTTLVTFVSAAALFQTETGRLALVDQWERTALAFGQDVDDARYSVLQRASERGAEDAGLTALAGGPALTVALAAIIYGVFTGLRGGPGSFRQVLAVTAFAGVILALRQVVVSPLDFARETLASPTTLSLMAPGLEEGSPIARFLGAIDAFVVWWVVVLGLGVAAVYGRPARRVVAEFVGAYVILALLLVIGMAISGGAA